MIDNKSKSDIHSRYKSRVKGNLFFFILLALVGIATIFLAIRPKLINWPVTSVPEDKIKLEGIDVSNHQGEINWDEIDQYQVNFVFIKATEGTTFTDKSFKTNWEESKEAGFLRGAYHYFNITSDGKKQAEHFISVVPKEQHTLPPVIDIEEIGENQAKLIVELRKYAETVEEHYGIKPIFYVNKKTYELYVRDNFKDHHIWFAAYDREPSIDDWTFWQYTDNGTSHGIKGPVDFNYYNGDKTDIMNLATE